jgi:hypothetical protein
MLNAALVIDPENTRMTATIINLRDSFVKDLVLRLEAEIEKDFPDKFRDAEKLLITNQLAKAEILVKQINAEEPESARAFYIKGFHLYLCGSQSKWKRNQENSTNSLKLLQRKWLT